MKKFAFFSIVLLLFIVYAGLTLRDIRSQDDQARVRLSRNYLARHILAEQRRLKRKAAIITLNHFLPSFDGLVKFIQDPQANDPRELKAYSRYYEQVVEIFPGLGEAYGMLGLCYYYQGEREKAVNNYQKAIELSPGFFWPYYNLGIILFNEKLYDSASKIFALALKTTPQETLRIMYSSRVYQQILSEAPQFREKIPAQLKTAYEDSVRLFKLGPYIKDHPDDKKLGALVSGHLPLKIF